ncbi:hypothetical protein PTKIN_Ptkin07bG0299000 [Pterospermum kingtungense]
MLYQTHQNPFFFTSISALCSSSNPLVLPYSLQEMECFEAALKTSFKKEMALKYSSTPQAFLDDVWVVNAQNGVSCDDFSVEDLFDFSNEDDGFLEQQHKEEEEEPVSCSPKRQKLDLENHFSNGTTSFDYSTFLLSTSELAVPVLEKKLLFVFFFFHFALFFSFLRYEMVVNGEKVPFLQADDVADLEWLSHFVEDSFSEHSNAYPTGAVSETPNFSADKWSEHDKAVTTTCFETPVPAKARSKRTRTGGKVWSFVASPSVTESSLSSTTSSSSSSPSSHWFVYPNSGSGCSGSTFELAKPLSLEKPPVKKQKKRPATDSTGENGTQPMHRCSHCGVTKTPQWRAGPMGAKTLCNACGVRFKSGRLLPEYRPACSPTFSSDLHSNHHRKVLEMRRKTETLGEAEPGLAPRIVPSFG